MKKKKDSILIIEGETFPYDVCVCLGVTREEIFAYFEKKFTDGLSENDKERLVMKGIGRTVHLDNKALVLWLKNYPTTSSGFGCLAHEIFHTADLILRYSGLTLSNDSDEVWAYQIDWLTKRIYKEFKLTPK